MSPGPYWNVISVALPIAAAIVAATVLGGSTFGDYGGALGGALKAFMAVGGICLLGEAAAIAALVRGERMAWLTVIGILANAAVILPTLYLVSRME